jgi:hypothetical protein
MFQKKNFGLSIVIALLSAMLVGAPAQAATSATVSWVKTIQGTGNAEAYATAVDAAGNLYVAGYLGGPWSNHSPAITNASVGDFLIAKYAADGTETWVSYLGATGGAGVKDIAIDASGNVYGTGWFCGTATIGALGNFAAVGNCDGFVLKLNSSGTPLAFKKFGKAATWAGSDGLALDSSGNVYIGAYFGDVPGVGAAGIDGVTWSASGSGWDGHVVLKLNSSLVAQRATPMPRYFYLDGYGHPFTVSPAGKVLIGGSFNGTATFGSFGPFTSVADDAAWVEIDTAGTISICKVYTGLLAQTIRGLAYDSNGNIIVQGLYESTTTVAGQSLTSNGDTDAYVTKLDSTGTTKAWLTSWGGTLADDAEGLALDSADNMVVAGSFKGTSTLGSLGTITSVGAANDGLAVGLNSDGSFGWVKTMAGTSDNEIAWAKPALGAGFALFGGRFNSNTDFGDGITATFTTAANTVDGFFEKVSINWQTPPSGAGAQVSVQAPDVYKGPKFSSISPNKLTGLTEANVQITGLNLDTIKSIALDGVALKTSAQSATSITVTVPAHAAGTGTLKFNTSEGVLTFTDALKFDRLANTVAVTLVYKGTFTPGQKYLTAAQKSEIGALAARFVKLAYLDVFATSTGKISATAVATVLAKQALSVGNSGPVKAENTTQGVGWSQRSNTITVQFSGLIYKK